MHQMRDDMKYILADEKKIQETCDALAEQINKDYQLVCLLAKADTIENSLLRFGEKYYRKESFVYVVNIGLTAELSTGLSFNDIKTELIKLYNAA